MEVGSRVPWPWRSPEGHIIHGHGGYQKVTGSMVPETLEQGIFFGQNGQIWALLEQNFPKFLPAEGF